MNEDGSAETEEKKVTESTVSTENELSKQAVSHFERNNVSDFSGYGYHSYDIYSSGNSFREEVWNQADKQFSAQEAETTDGSEYAGAASSPQNEFPDSSMHTEGSSGFDTALNTVQPQKASKYITVETLPKKTVREKHTSHFKVIGILAGVYLGLFVIVLGLVYFVKVSKNFDSYSQAWNSAAGKEYESASKENPTDEPVPEIPVGNPQSLAQLSQNSVDIVKNVKPAVVCITSLSEERDFFDMSYYGKSAGSGVIFDERGDDIYIVTNCHVIDGAYEVGVSIEESDLISAELVGKSEKDDIAVIKISKKDASKNGVKNIKTAKFGNSDAMGVSSPVIALGNALGEGNTATLGIISMAPREITINNTKLMLMQTDTAINPGNSGGALVNGAGEVIGINTAKMATTSVEGVGYSIPINTVIPVIEKLINNQDSPYLGIYIQTVNSSIAEYLDIPETGVLVSGFIDGMDADGSGLHEGDVITSINGTPVFTAEQLADAVSKYKVGDKADLSIIRNGKQIEVTITLKARPAAFK